MFCYLINIKYHFFYNRNSFWIVTIHDRSKTSPVNAYGSLGKLKFSNVIDIDNLLVKNSKRNRKTQVEIVKNSKRKRKNSNETVKNSKRYLLVKNSKRIRKNSKRNS